MSAGTLAGGTLPDGTAYVVRRAESDEDRAACFLVRKEVFVQEQGVPEDLEYDALDAGAAHVLALADDGTPLGAGRLLHGEAAWEPTGHTAGAGSLGRLAVRG
ncbi:acetyltransferase, partial [Streptomyces sp. SPB78]